MTEAYLTKRELAARLSCSVRTIERLRLPSMRVGGQNRYLMSQVERALAGGSQPPADNVIPLRPRTKEHAA